MKTKKIVITTIRKPTPGIIGFSSVPGWELIVVGDRKTPFINGNFRYIPIENQLTSDLAYPSYCRENHYARKNIGYLYAMKNGAEIIAESDDDNIPYSWWGNVSLGMQDVTVYSGATLFNIYRLFQDGYWPRGYPLENINIDHAIGINQCRQKVGVRQFMADLNPDVDAIHRMTTKDKKPIFQNIAPFTLDKHTYCPFNSQNTFWAKECFPLMYLPQTVTMRFCDILRGYVAQRIMWERDIFLGFGPATVYQERNKHDLFKDFIDEIPMYRNVGKVVKILGSLELHGSFTDMLSQVYQKLAMEDIVSMRELISLDAWNEDVEAI